MTVARSVADVLTEYVMLEVECIDRMYLNVYQPRLQHVNGVVWFFRGHRGATFASSVLMDPISKSFVASIHRFCQDRQVPLVSPLTGTVAAMGARGGRPADERLLRRSRRPSPPLPAAARPQTWPSCPAMEFDATASSAGEFHQAPNLLLLSLSALL